MRYFLLLFLFVLSCCALQAQQDPSSRDFQQMRQELLNEYDDFRKEINEEYADFLSQSWKEFKLFQGHAMFEDPKPHTPVTAPKEQKNKEAIAEISGTEVKSGSSPDDIPVHTMKEIPATEPFRGTPMKVLFYGASLTMHYRNEPFRLPSIQETAIGNLWKDISKSKYANLLADMLDYKEKMQMNDWAYFLLTKQVAFQLSTFKGNNNCLVFQHFLLVQSGYDIRLARTDNDLALLVPIAESVYNRPYLQFDGKPYYVISDKKLNSYTSIYSYELPANLKTGNRLSLHISQPPLLPMQPKTFSIAAAGLTVEGTANLNMIHFYRDYPSCELSVYAKAEPEKKFAQSLIQSLKTQLNGKNPTEALNKLLSWAQLGFAYQTDNKQFGFEKPFFIEENFYYPANDCEDRAILFAFLVRKLLKQDVLLLDYPDHVATAVKSPPPVNGDFLTYKQQKYTICDPTYINASAGNCMPKYKIAKAKIITLN